MEYFLSCDWGTSSFRLRLIGADSLKVIAEITSDAGIADTYQSWTRQQPAADRQLFYTRIIDAQIARLGTHPNVQQLAISLGDIPVVLSGMASSTIGLMDMSYKALPFRLDGSDLNLQVLKGRPAANPIIIISGARTHEDVMRGEETKIVGCAPWLTEVEGEVQMVLPGTHPKHVRVKDQQVQSFRTYMTGEFFDLLASRSVLSASVEEGGSLEDPANLDSFTEGVKAASSTSLLHVAFMVRTRQVLRQVPLQQNYHYLSGLLIGTELHELNPLLPLYLVGSAPHTELYSLACKILAIPIVMKIDANEALIRGQQRVYAISRTA